MPTNHPATKQCIVLASRPKGALREENFRLESRALSSLNEGEVLVQTHFLSIDPYMRARLDDVKSYAPPQQLDEVMIGGAVGEVLASRHAQFQAGDKVAGMLGWSDIGVIDGKLLRPIAESRFPLSWHLGVLGMPGATAWYGLTQILQAKENETVLVSAASGAVGGLVGQLAKLRGCRVVGIAGGAEKCAYVRDVLGFDACVDYRSEHAEQALALACPQGVDALFENVGGVMLDASLLLMNPYGRIAMCGMIAAYEGEQYALKNMRMVTSMRLTMRGFIITEHLNCWPQAWQELGDLLAQNKLVVRESLVEGLAQAPHALIGLLRGQNLGKQIVRVRTEEQ